MKNSKGRGVIRLGDKTSHGGQVISSSDNFIVRGKHVALHGDLTVCPKCKGTFPIQVPDSERQHCGKQVAYQDDLTTCGALLVSSL